MANRIKARAERNTKIRRTISEIEKTINKLERMKDEYLQKAIDAKSRGDNASYSLAKSGLNVTLSQIKRANEMLLNIEITSELQRTGDVNADFLSGMSTVAKRIAKVNRKSDFVKLQKEISKALSGMAEAQAGLDNFLQNTDSQFAALSNEEGSLSDRQIDALVDGQIGERELLMDEQLDKLLSGIDGNYVNANSVNIAVGGTENNATTVKVNVGGGIAQPTPMPIGRFEFEGKSSNAVDYTKILEPSEGINVIALADVIEPCNNAAVYLGRNADGDVSRVLLKDTPSIFISGVVGSGKTSFLHQAICSLVLTNSAEQLRLLIVDVNGKEFSCYNGIPHMVCDTITDSQVAKVAFDALQSEIERRYEIILSGGELNLPSVVMVIDEIDALNLDDGKTMSAFCRLLRQAQAVGVYVLAATRNVNSKTVTPFLLNSFNARIAFRMASKDDATLVGVDRAEKLTKAGCFIFAKNNVLTVYNAPCVTQNDIARTVSALSEDRL